MHRPRSRCSAPWLALALLLPAAVGCAAAAGPAGPDAAVPPPHWTAAADLDGDGVAEGLAGWFDAGRRRGVLLVTRGDARWTSPLYPMWKAQTADLDGDGRDEVVLGVWSWRRRHAEPLPHRSVWVLGWDGRALVERWRGSALARPLVDVDVEAPGAGSGRALLVAQERSAAGCHRTRYRWTGFGFAGVDREDRPCPVAPD